MIGPHHQPEIPTRRMSQPRLKSAFNHRHPSPSSSALPNAIPAVNSGTMRTAARADALLGLLALLVLPAVASAASLTLYLPSKPNPFSLPPSTHATLSALGSHYSAPLSAANTFVFQNVTHGSYLVDVHCTTDAFFPLRVDIGLNEKAPVQAWETYRGNDWGNKGEAVPVKEGSAGTGIEVRSIGGKNYFVERPTFSVLSILKNPMILMGLVSMGLFFGMPYLMDNMDPELRAEFEAHQKQSPMNAVMNGQAAENPLGGFDMAAYLAGSGKKDGGSGSAGNGQGAKR